MDIPIRHFPEWLPASATEASVLLTKTPNKNQLTQRDLDGAMLRSIGREVKPEGLNDIFSRTQRSKRARGRQSPRNLPMGRSSLTLSQTAFNPAVNGMASSKPGASHRKPQSISEKVTTSGFRWTREPTTLG